LERASVLGPCRETVFGAAVDAVAAAAGSVGSGWIGPENGLFQEEETESGKRATDCVPYGGDPV